MTSLNQNQWVDIQPGGYTTSVYNFKFYTTGDEVRPKNTAIKIWKRIE